MLITTKHQDNLKTYDLLFYPNSLILGQGKLSKYVKVNPGCAIVSSNIKSYSYTSSSLYNCTIGSYTSIAAQVSFVGNHALDRLTTSPCTMHSEDDDLFANFKHKTPSDPTLFRGKVEIGHDVWIGSHVIIMPNVKIGNGAVIGAGAVVTKDVPDFAIQVGVPAKTKRMRFSDQWIERILGLKWWEHDWANLDVHWQNFEETLDEMEALLSKAPLISYNYVYVADQHNCQFRRI